MARGPLVSHVYKKRSWNGSITYILYKTGLFGRLSLICFVASEDIKQDVYGSISQCDTDRPTATDEVKPLLN